MEKRRKSHLVRRTPQIDVPARMEATKIVSFAAKKTSLSLSLPVSLTATLTFSPASPLVRSPDWMTQGSFVATNKN